MASLIQEFKSECDEDNIRSKFSGIDDSETPIWAGRPSAFSMSSRYLLAGVVLIIHIVFFWVAEGAKVEGGGLRFILRLLLVFFDKIDVFSFVIFMLIFARINHYLNTSTSGRWTTAWLIGIGTFPFLWVLSKWLEFLLMLFDVSFNNPLPFWIDHWFILLGIVSTSIMVIASAIYQYSYEYAITNSHIHIRRQILFFGVSNRSIPFNQLRNLKTQQSRLGMLLGFGNLLLITPDETSTEENDSGESALVKNLSITRLGLLFKLAHLLLVIQRKRDEEIQNPSRCLFGVNDPMRLYGLLNELMDEHQGRPGLLEQVQGE